MVAVVAWLAWALLSPVFSGNPMPWTSPYLFAPLVLLVGVGAGRLLGVFAGSAVLPAALFALALGAFWFVDLYDNADAALGIQLVAVAALVVLGRRADTATLVPATGILTLGVLLAARADAATILVLPLVLLCASGIVARAGPRRRVLFAGAVLLLLMATAVVVALGRLEVWPGWLSDSANLSAARHTLWGDALALWSQHPVTGGGAGSFLASSELAAGTKGLETVHSSVLQVGSELGLVGLVLFGGVLAASLLLAAEGPRTRALVAVAAFTALGVHSVIDHLYEHVSVTLAAGVVVGWGGASSPVVAEPAP